MVSISISSDVKTAQNLLILFSGILAFASVSCFLSYVVNVKDTFILFMSIILACLCYILGALNISLITNKSSNIHFLLGSFFYIIMFTLLAIIYTNSVVPFTPNIYYNRNSNIETHNTIFRLNNSLSDKNLPFGNYIGCADRSLIANISPGTTAVGFRFMGSPRDPFAPKEFLKIGINEISPGITGCLPVDTGWDCCITGVTGPTGDINVTFNDCGSTGSSFATELQLNQKSKLQWKHGDNIMGINVERYESAYSVQLQEDGVFAFLIEKSNDKTETPFNIGYVCSFDKQIQQSWSLYSDINISSNQISLNNNSLPMNKLVLWSMTKNTKKIK